MRSRYSAAASLDAALARQNASSSHLDAASDKAFLADGERSIDRTSATARRTGAKSFVCCCCRCGGRAAAAAAAAAALVPVALVVADASEPTTDGPGEDEEAEGEEEAIRCRSCSCWFACAAWRALETVARAKEAGGNRFDSGIIVVGVVVVVVAVAVVEVEVDDDCCCCCLFLRQEAEAPDDESFDAASAH